MNIANTSAGHFDIYICKAEDNLRGYEFGEVPKLIADIAINHGIDKKYIYYADSPFTAMKHIVSN